MKKTKTKQSSRILLIRIEDDKDITKLLTHDKYRMEYNLNIENQGFVDLVLDRLIPVVFEELIVGYFDSLLKGEKKK